MFKEKLQALFRPFWKSERISPARIIIFGFLLLILMGTVLLMLPFPHGSGAARASSTRCSPPPPPPASPDW